MDHCYDGTVAPLDEIVGGIHIVRRLLGDAAVERPLWRIGLFLREAIERDGEGDPHVKTVIAGAGRELGHVAAQYTHFVRPDVVLIAGALTMAPSYMAAFLASAARGGL